MRLGASLLLSFALAGFIALPSSADTIQLGINGDASVGSNYIDFGTPFPTPTDCPTCFTAAPGYGQFEVTQINAGVFETGGVTLGELGMIQSLNEKPGPQSCPDVNNGLCNGAFMKFNAGGSNLQLWVTNIPPGAVGPFVLTDTADGAVASFDVDGYIWNTNTNSKVDTFTGTFSATFDGQSVASLFLNLPINTPYSATFTATTIPTTIPEPASMLLMGAGLLGLGLVSRRRTRKS